MKKVIIRNVALLVILINIQFSLSCAYKLRNPLYKPSIRAIEQKLERGLTNIQNSHEQIDKLKKDNIEKIEKQADSILKNTNRGKDLCIFFTVLGTIVSGLVPFGDDSYDTGAAVSLVIITPIMPLLNPPLTRKQALSFRDEISSIINGLNLEWAILHEQDEENLNKKKALLADFDKNCSDIKEKYGIIYETKK